MASKEFLGFCLENEALISELVNKYSDYEPLEGMSEKKFLPWLEQFQQQHRVLALKLAHNIYYYGIHEITKLMIPMHKLVLQHIDNVGANKSEALFVPLGANGESGADIIRRYRNANSLHSWQNRFIGKSEIIEKTYQAKKPIVVFFDDFVGTGGQVEKYWEEVLRMLVPEYHPIILAVIAALPEGIDHIENTTPIKVLPVHTIHPKFQINKSACNVFSSQEKHTIERYCNNAGYKPLGHGDCGLLLSFALGTPNNTIAAIRGSKGQKPWRGLLPGWEDLIA